MKEAATTDKAAKEKADEEKKSAEADRKELLTKLGSYRCQSSPAASWITYILRKSSFNTASSHQTGMEMESLKKCLKEMLDLKLLPSSRLLKPHSVQSQIITFVDTVQNMVETLTECQEWGVLHANSRTQH